MSIKAIETIYNGYRFRSRLEARWAVFFDALNIHYEYEPEGFDLGTAGWYLPDFWLPQQQYWIEIKPRIDEVEQLNDIRFKAFDEALSKEYEKQQALTESPIHWTSFFVLCGDPYLDSYQVLGPKLFDWQYEQPRTWTECPLCERIAIGAIEAIGYWGTEDKIYEGLSCEWCDIWDRRSCPDTDNAFFHKGHVFAEPGQIDQSSKLISAYNTARQARFEHGEIGR